MPGSPHAPSATYRFAMRVCSPIVRRWGRMTVTGLDVLPESGPVLLASNHDSHWDPVVIGVAGLRRRQIKALAKSSLWKPGLGHILDGMGQIPIDRGAGDAHALDRAVAELRGGACIGVFPEGTISRGAPLRARSGFGRLAEAVPEAQIVCVATRGVVDIVRFPRRPRIEVEFFTPREGGPRPGESPADLAVRLISEIRERAPEAAAGRKVAPVPPPPTPAAPESA